LWGWEPKEVQTHEYDEQGRLSRTVVVREPEFDVEQLNMLRAIAQFDESLNEFGIPLDVATSAEADPANRKGRQFKVESVVDWSAYAVGKHLEQIEKARGGDPFKGARRVSVTLD